MLELETPEEELGSRPGSTLTAPGMLGAEPGRNTAGLIFRLAFKKKKKKSTLTVETTCNNFFLMCASILRGEKKAKFTVNSLFFHDVTACG